MTDTAQLLVFVCGVDSSFQVTEELAGLMSLHGQTTGLKIFNSVKSVIDDLGLSWDTSAVVGSRNGFLVF